MSTENLALSNKLEEILSTLNRRFDALEGQTQKRVDEIKEEVKEIKNDFANFVNRDDYQRRSKNLIVLGLKGKNNREIFEEFINVCHCIKIDIRKYDVERVHIINSDEGKGLAKISLTSIMLRNDILRNKKILAKSDSLKNIRIKEDLPFEVRRTRAKLFPFLVAQRKKGKQVFLKYDKLIIDGKPLSLEELEKSDEYKIKRPRGEESSPENEEGIFKASGSKSLNSPRTPKTPSSKALRKRLNRGRGGENELSEKKGNSLERYYSKVNRQESNVGKEEERKEEEASGENSSKEGEDEGGNSKGSTKREST